jgi:hypothetical protein
LPRSLTPERVKRALANRASSSNCRTPTICAPLSLTGMSYMTLSSNIADRPLAAEAARATDSCWRRGWLSFC